MHNECIEHCQKKGENTYVLLKSNIIYSNAKIYQNPVVRRQMLLTIVKGKEVVGCTNGQHKGEEVGFYIGRNNST